MRADCFLAVVFDLFSRRIIGWSLREQITGEIVTDALRMAWFLRCPNREAGLIFHSDRGSQYASHEFNKVLNECGITPSMSRKGNCWDYACSETLFGSLKVESLHVQHFETRRQGKGEALDWLLWYNQTRLHSTLNCVSPNANGGTRTNGPVLRLASTGGNAASQRPRPRRVPHSPSDSRRAVCSGSGSSGSRRRRGNNPYPHPESSGRSEWRMSKMDSLGTLARTIATAAWGFYHIHSVCRSSKLHDYPF